ncbi:MAG: methyltransferase domain-containing protein [Actinomycetota bacterium]|nr:methyltransferase domain-containing protein [Actinomycetota bacterium]
MGNEDAGLAWQVGVWDGISRLYWEEVDRRFEPVVDGVVQRAELKPGERVLDLGTGTGAVAAKAAAAVSPEGEVVAVDISPEMLALARQRADQPGGHPYRVTEGRAEAIPAPDGSFDAVLASLSLMYAIDREAAARELGRVLRPGGRLVAAVWGDPDVCDIVLFQQTAGSFAPSPPVPGVGPGALADAGPFLDQLARHGIRARVETEISGFDFPNFMRAWEVLARVTTAALSPERREEAQAAVCSVMWPAPGQRRAFRNTTQFIVGIRS